MKNFMDKYSVSRETFERLKAYEKSLHEWQKRFNLVSLNTSGNVIFLILLSCLNLFPMVPGRWLILALVLGSREWCWL